MDERRLKILTSLIREHVRLADPISSELIWRRCRLGISPATIRNELGRLTDEGYLEQPHTSAGRVPTNAGWRFYVDNVVLTAPAQNFSLSNRFGSFGDVARILAEMSGIMAACVNEAGETYLAGLAQLFSQPDFESREQFEKLAETIELLEDEPETIFSGLAKEAPNILIGRENRRFGNNDVSWLFGGFQMPRLGRGLAILIGPKRMHYKKNWSLINALANANR